MAETDETAFKAVVKPRKLGSGFCLGLQPQLYKPADGLGAKQAEGKG